MASSIRTVMAPADAVLHHIAPLGLAASAGTALVLDLDGVTSTYPGLTLASLAASGMRREHLEPARSGVAVIGRGTIGPEAALELVERLTPGWPRTVIRLPGPVAGLPVPIVVAPRLPHITPPESERVVWQRFSRFERIEGTVLPPIGRRRILQLLGSVVDPRWRWVRAWRPVWGVSWS